MNINITILSVLMQFASVDGHVRDAQTHKPLTLVRIELSHLGVANATEYTNEDGRFHFANVITGNYMISASSVGYELETVELNLQGSDTIQIELARIADHKHPLSSVVSVGDYVASNKAQVEFEKARNEISRHDCEKAVVHLENGLRLVEEPSALNDLGNCYVALGELDRAKTSFTNATRLSNSVYIAMNLAEVYARQAQLGKAAAVLHAAIQNHPDSGDAYYGLGVIYFKQGRLGEARAAAFQAESRPHRIADLHLLLAKIYAKLNEEDVPRQLKLYLKEAPDGAESERVREALRSAKSK